MKRNKIISILEISIRNKMLIALLTVSLIGASGMMLAGQENILNNNLSTNKVVLAQTNSNSYTTYTVQSGNTLSQIAYKYSVTVFQLEQWNNISNPNVIYVGQTLKIYTNKGSSDNSSNNTSNNNSSSSYTTYTVQSGNTLSQIAYKYSVTVSQLEQWNNISNPNVIYVGQTLKIYTNKGSSDNSSNNTSGNNSTGSSNSSSNSSDSSTTNTSKIGYLYNSYNKIYISNTPNTRYAVAVYGNGVKVTILGEEDGFYKIEYGNNKIGYTLTSNISFTAPKTSGIGYTTDKAFVYEGMNSQNVIAVFPSETKVTVLGLNDGWYKIEYYNEAFGYTTIGYTSCDNISFTVPSSSSQNTSQPLVNINKMGYIYNAQGGMVYVYEQANEGSNALTSLISGTKVTVLCSSNGWYKIEYSNNEIGYIPASNISFTREYVVENSTQALELVQTEIGGFIGGAEGIDIQWHIANPNLLTGKNGVKYYSIVGYYQGQIWGTYSVLQNGEIINSNGAVMNPYGEVFKQK